MEKDETKESRSSSEEMKKKRSPRTMTPSPKGDEMLRQTSFNLDEDKEDDEPKKTFKKDLDFNLLEKKKLRCRSSIVESGELSLELKKMAEEEQPRSKTPRLLPSPSSFAAGLNKKESGAKTAETKRRSEKESSSKKKPEKKEKDSKKKEKDKDKDQKKKKKGSQIRKNSQIQLKSARATTTQNSRTPYNASTYPPSDALVTFSQPLSDENLSIGKEEDEEETLAEEGGHDSTMETLSLDLESDHSSSKTPPVCRPSFETAKTKDSEAIRKIERETSPVGDAKEKKQTRPEFHKTGSRIFRRKDKTEKQEKQEQPSTEDGNYEPSPSEISSHTRMATRALERRMTQLKVGRVGLIENAVLKQFMCALLRKALFIQGMMHICASHLCFTSVVLNRVEEIDFHNIVSLQKKRTFRVIPNAIEICTNEKKFFFSSFIHRDDAFKLLEQQWRLNVKGDIRVRHSDETNGHSTILDLNPAGDEEMKSSSFANLPPYSAPVKPRKRPTPSPPAIISPRTLPSFGTRLTQTISTPIPLTQTPPEQTEKALTPREKTSNPQISPSPPQISLSSPQNSHEPLPHYQNKALDEKKVQIGDVGAIHSRLSQILDGHIRLGPLLIANDFALLFSAFLFSIYTICLSFYFSP